jgi:hypothetical protein
MKDLAILTALLLGERQSVSCCICFDHLIPLLFLGETQRLLPQFADPKAKFPISPAYSVERLPLLSMAWAALVIPF